MLYLQDEKLVFVSITGEPEYTDFSDLIDVVIGIRHRPTYAVDRNGHVWQVTEKTIDVVLGLDNIKSIKHVHDTCDSFILSMITRDNRIANAELSKSSEIIRVETYDYPENVVNTSFDYSLDSEGQLYELSDDGKYVKKYEDLRFTMMAPAINHLLATSGVVYDTDGAVVFNREPVCHINDRSVLAKNGDVHDYGDEDEFYKWLTIECPSDVIQTYAEFGIFVALYRDRTALVYRMAYEESYDYIGGRDVRWDMTQKLENIDLIIGS